MTNNLCENSLVFSCCAMKAYFFEDVIESINDYIIRPDTPKVRHAYIPENFPMIFVHYGHKHSKEDSRVCTVIFETKKIVVPTMQIYNPVSNI